MAGYIRQVVNRLEFYGGVDVVDDVANTDRHERLLECCFCSRPLKRRLRHAEGRR